MEKYVWKIIAIIILIPIFMWMYGWYIGKVAPSVADVSVIENKEAVAYFAGGCFWCTESDYEKLNGVKDVVSGYMGGSVQNPSYNQVASGGTGHREVVKVVYNPIEITYRELALELFRETDPTDSGGSFYDRGHQYTSAVYYKNDEERQIVEEIIEEIEKRNIFNKPITTSIEPVSTFWIAETYHQNYHTKNPLQYKYYRNGSGRDAFIESVWGSGEHDDLFIKIGDKINLKNSNMNQENIWEQFEKPSDETLVKTLTPLQYKVTQKEGTEKPFQNEYWDNHEEGIYVDIVSGEPLFSSTDKFDSGTGWPSFLKPIDYDFVTEHKDFKLIIPRTEIRSKYADSHLGHIILDGPIENDKIRYCINSAALRFVPKKELESEGLGEYLSLFT